MSKTLKVYPCGTTVYPKNCPQIVSTITAISIRFSKYSYECSYFWNGEYKQVWLDENEFTVDDNTKIKVGFK